MVVHTFSPSVHEAEAGILCEFNVSLVYTVSYRTVRAVCRGESCLKEQNETKNEIDKPCYKFIALLPIT